MTMKMPLLPTWLVLCCLFSGAAWADQRDSRLDGLFDRLQGTENAREARDLEARIWTIWFAYDGDDPTVDRLMRYAGVAMSQGDQSQAERYLTQVTERAPDFAEGWNRRATSRYLAGNYEGSIADVQRTLQLEPRHFGALSGLGLIYSALDEPERALAAFQAALEVNPHMTGARANIEHLRELLEGDPI